MVKQFTPCFALTDRSKWFRRVTPVPNMRSAVSDSFVFGTNGFASVEAMSCLGFGGVDRESTTGVGLPLMLSATSVLEL